MLVDEAHQKLDTLAIEDVKELARKELLRRDVHTLADVCVTLMDKEQLSEWAVPFVVNEEREKRPVKYGRLNENALKRLFPKFTVEEDKVRIPLGQSATIANEMFETNSVRLVCEGYSGDHLLMGVWAIVEEMEEVSEQTKIENTIKYLREGLAKLQQVADVDPNGIDRGAILGFQTLISDYEKKLAALKIGA